MQELAEPVFMPGSGAGHRPKVSASCGSVFRSGSTGQKIQPPAAQLSGAGQVLAASCRASSMWLCQEGGVDQLSDRAVLPDVLVRLPGS